MQKDKVRFAEFYELHDSLVFKLLNKYGIRQTEKIMRVLYDVYLEENKPVKKYYMVRPFRKYQAAIRLLKRKLIKYLKALKRAK